MEHYVEHWLYGLSCLADSVYVVRAGRECLARFAAYRILDCTGDRWVENSQYDDPGVVESFVIVSSTPMGTLVRLKGHEDPRVVELSALCLVQLPALCANPLGAMGLHCVCCVYILWPWKLRCESPCSGDGFGNL